MKINKKGLVTVIVAAVPFTFLFQNCSKYSFQIEDSADLSSQSRGKTCFVQGEEVNEGNFEFRSGFTSSHVPAGSTCISDSYRGTCVNGLATIEHSPAFQNCVVDTASDDEGCQLENGSRVAVGSFNIPAGYTSSTASSSPGCVVDSYIGTCSAAHTITYTHKPVSSTCQINTPAQCTLLNGVQVPSSSAPFSFTYGYLASSVPAGQSCQSGRLEGTCTDGQVTYTKQPYLSCSASQSPTDCTVGFHKEGQTCVPNTRSCMNQPNSLGGVETWNSSTSSWGNCQNFTCNQNYYFDDATSSCVLGCGPKNPGETRAEHSWGLPHIGGIEKRCSGTLQKMPEGASQTLISNNGQPGSVKVMCTNSKYVFASEPTYGQHTNSDWHRYMVKVFNNDTLDISCNNQLIQFANPRVWESCTTASSSICFAKTGNTPTTIKECNVLRVSLDDEFGVRQMTQVNGQYMGQIFQSSYKVYLSYGGISREITSDLSSGYGEMPTIQNIKPLYGATPAGFSFVTRSDMGGKEITIRLVATVRGVPHEAVSKVNVTENESCDSSYDGSGLANFVLTENQVIPAMNGR